MDNKTTKAIMAEGIWAAVTWAVVTWVAETFNDLTWHAWAPLRWR